MTCDFDPAAPFEHPRQDMTTDKRELLPCPHCGGTDLSLQKPTCRPETPYNAADRLYPRVVCKGCNASVPGKNEDYTAKSAVEAWNRRPSSVPVQVEATTFDEIWQGLLDKDDRNSPEEYPDMVLITQDELRAALSSPLQGRRAAIIEALRTVPAEPKEGIAERAADAVLAALSPDKPVGSVQVGVDKDDRELRSLEDKIDIVAHMVTGLYASRCCHITGGLQRDDAKCECRQVARDIISALSQAAEGCGTHVSAPPQGEQR